ncbi:hypothetical protein VWY73_12485 [Phaeobacter sp. JH20_12]|uniref:hypothetical protein n=1 Tax=unclassified Phaeobacter TaxID=2621772 RepID=UPI003A85775B
MLDRLIEVFACYGAIMLLIMGFAHFSNRFKNHGDRGDFLLFSGGGFALLTFVPGTIYALTGLIPGQ